ncbi:MAG: ATP-binding protein [Acidobacteriota bacterium]
MASPLIGDTTAKPMADVVKLLAVDDDRDNLLALQAVLDPLGQQIMLAESGSSALRLCLEHEFAAILMDVRMPDMDGFETAELIRSRKVSRQTPILFLTAYRSDEQLFRGYDLGAVDFLFKPIVPEILQSKVAVFVEMWRSEQLLRRQTEELARTEQQFRALLEAAPDALVITDQDGIIAMANTRTDALFNYPRPALIGQDIRVLIPDWKFSEVPDMRNGASPPLSERRITGVRHLGRQFPAGITVSPVRTSESLLITTAIRDATDQVLAEQRVQKVNLELEQRVAERTLALTQSNEALQQFAWAASHDLQEPIRTVLTYANWLHESAEPRLDDKERQILAVIEQHASHLHRLVTALREYTHLSERGQQKWTLVDCNAVVALVAAGLEKSIEESSAIIEFGSLPTLPSIEILLVQLFQNLISNAIKYRSSDPPRIVISAEAIAGGWRFSVRDNGIGIDPQYADYIFGVFRRLHGKEQPGTGIGLALCKAAVERLSGRIWVEPTEGSGSTFHFFLPSKELA